VKDGPVEGGRPPRENHRRRLNDERDGDDRRRRARERGAAVSVGGGNLRERERERRRIGGGKKFGELWARGRERERGGDLGGRIVFSFSFF